MCPALTSPLDPHDLDPLPTSMPPTRNLKDHDGEEDAPDEALSEEDLGAMEALLDIPDLAEVNLDVEVKSWVDGSTVGNLSLAPDVFGVPVRRDVVHDVVRWQLAKRRSGNAQVGRHACCVHRVLRAWDWSWKQGVHVAWRRVEGGVAVLAWQPAAVATLGVGCSSRRCTHQAESPYFCRCDTLWFRVLCLEV